MTNKTITISYLVFVILFSLSCNTWQNHLGMSEDINEAKKRGVYICEYEAKPNPISINDSLIFTIKEAWLEKRWKYPQDYDKTNPIEGYQLIVITKNNINKGIGKTWSIGIDFNRYIRPCGENCLITDFEKLPISNQEIWKVQKGRKLNAEAVKELLGDFTLYKKQSL